MSHERSPSERRQAAASKAAAALLAAGVAACLLAAWPLPPRDPLDFLQPKTVLCALFGLGAAAAYLWRGGELSLDFETAALTAISLAGLVAALAVADNATLAQSAAATSAATAAAFLVSRRLCERHRGCLEAVVVAALAVAAALAIAEAWGLAPRLSTANRAPGATLGNRNYLSHVLVLGLPLTAHLALDDRRARRALAIGGALVSAYVIVLGRSRGAWIGAGVAVVGIALVTLPSARAAPRRLAALACALAFGAAAALAIASPLRWRSPTPFRETVATLLAADSGSGRGRVVQLVRSLAMARDHLALGVGPGNWPIHYPRYAAPGDPSVKQGSFEPTNRFPSSDLVAVTTERGAAVALLLACVLACQIGRSLRRWRGAHAERDRARAGLGATTALVIAWLGLVDSVAIAPASGLVAAVLLGALVPAPRAGTPGRAPLLARRGAACAIAALALWAGAGEAGRLGGRALLRAGGPIGDREALLLRLASGDYPVRIGIALGHLAQRRCDLAAEHLRIAAALMPAARRPRRLLAACERAFAPRSAR